MSDREVRVFNRFVSGIFSDCWKGYDFANKEKCINQYVLYMLDRTQSMFKWSGLPDSIPSRILELFLQINGNVCFYKRDGNLYVFTGGFGGKPDVYYRPTLYTVANPGLGFSANLVIDKDCIVMPNDSLFVGMLPMFNRYAAILAETELSLQMAVINSRVVNLLSAGDDRTKASAEKYLEDIKNGKIGVIAENSFLDGIKAQPYSQSANSNYLTNLIEVIQYNKASWFNEIGLNANYNMKRESINSGESQLNNDALLPLIDDMLKCRENAVKKVNDMFGTNISVSLDSSWEDNEQEIELEHEEKGGVENEAGETE